jgi:uncharacterized protein YukE
MTAAKQIIADLRLLSEQCRDLGEMRGEIARAKAESEATSKNLARLKQELVDITRQHGEAVRSFREEHKRLTTQSQEKQREVARLDAELNKGRAELAKIRQLLEA